MSKGDRTITIRGQKWKLRFVPNLGDDAGQCDYASRVIRVAFGQSQEDELDTIVHEILHAAYPDLDEYAVHDTAKAVSRVLWRLGWRKGE
jgi:hypothetical protein